MKYFFFIGFVALLFLSCQDDALTEAERANYVSAIIDSVEWEATETFTQKVEGENGPLTIVGEGKGYTLELVLGGITGPGEYPLGTNRTGRVKLGNNTYTTLDVQDAGQVTITRFKDNRVEGEFYFNAQWLSANNLLRVRDGKFSAFYY